MKTEILEHTPLATWFDAIPSSRWEGLLQTAMQGAARGLSEFVGHSVKITTLRVETVPLAQLAAYAGDPEAEAVGVYLLIEGDVCGQALLLMSPPAALNLVDMLLDAPPGATRRLGELECSALAEVGNLTVSYFLNAVAAFLEKPASLHPSPPAVMVDMLGAILDVVAAPEADVCDDLLVVETAFAQATGTYTDAGRAAPVRLWVLPAPAALPA